MIKYFLEFIIGITLFLFSIKNLTNILKNINKEKFNYLIKKTNNKLYGVFIGTLITSMCQSSSFVTSMLVSFINSNILSINNCIGIIMGSNIGTCLTSWIVSLSNSKLSFLNFLNINNLLGIIALISIFFFIKKRDTKANILFLIITLVLGINIMTNSLKPLSSDSFNTFLLLLSNPFLGLLTGIILTTIFQSSSLILGILASISVTTALPFISGFTLILGTNIGSCITSILASINTSKNSKLVGIFHLLFNIYGTVIFLIGFYILNYFFNFTFTYRNINSFDIALIHTVFNIGSTIILYPFTNFILKASKKILKKR